MHIDLLRFVASMGIVILHFSRFMSGRGQRMIGGTTDFALFVDLFFGLSGFIISYVYWNSLSDGPSYGRFMQKRVARLAPLHWATFAIFLLLGVLNWTGIAHSDYPTVYDPKCIVPNILALHAWGLCGALSFNDVSWSISAEMGMYLCAPLVIYASRRHAGWTIALLAAVIGALGLMPHQPWLAWTFYFGVARALPSFLVGALFYRFRRTVIKIPRPRALAMFLFVVFLAGARLNAPLIVLLPLVYAVIACVIACDISGNYSAPKAGALGQLTYSIYMIHPLVRTFFLSIVGGQILKVHGLGADAMVFVGICATIAIAWVSFVFFETPARQKISKLHIFPAGPKRSTLAVAIPIRHVVPHHDLPP